LQLGPLIVGGHKRRITMLQHFTKFKPVKAVTKALDANGHETPSSRPMAIPVGARRPETLAEQVARLVRTEEWRRTMESHDLETFEESEDFDIEDDPVDPSTPYEEVFDPYIGKSITPAEFEKNKSEYEKIIKKNV